MNPPYLPDVIHGKPLKLDFFFVAEKRVQQQTDRFGNREVSGHCQIRRNFCSGPRLFLLRQTTKVNSDTEFCQTKLAYLFVLESQPSFMQRHSSVPFTDLLFLFYPSMMGASRTYLLLACWHCSLSLVWAISRCGAQTHWSPSEGLFGWATCPFHSTERV